MKTFFASFFICLVLICGVLLLGALFGGFGLLLLTALALAAPVSILVTTLETGRKKQEELEKRICELEGRRNPQGSSMPESPDTKN